MSFKRGIALTSLFAVVILTGQGCVSSGPREVESVPVTLEYWRVFDDRNAFDPIIAAYRSAHPNVTINYRRVRIEDYEKELVRALAEGRGPDLFSVHNTQMREMQDLLFPMPATLTISEQQVSGGGFNRKVSTFEKQVTTPSIRTITQNNVAQVSEDVILPYRPDPRADAANRVFGLPLSVDSLALYYNKDLLDAAGIATPPRTWTDFQTAVQALTVYDAEGNVAQSGAAIGGAQNVERSADILSLLMMQNGTQMVDDRGRVSLHLVPAESTDQIAPGLLATEFYTDFANPTKAVYTWNSGRSTSFEAFANGQTAMFFGYSYHAPLLRTAAPRLNFDVAPMPQIDGSREINFANYWIEGVSAQSQNPDWAWDFLLFAAEQEQVVTYLNTAQKPTALRALIPLQIEDEIVGVFASQALTAKHWYKGKDIEAVEKALRDVITGFLASPPEPQDLLSNAARIISQTY